MAITFRENFAPLMRGRRVNAEEWNAYSRTFEDTSADAKLLFGVPAIAGTTERGCLNLTAAGQSVIGITETNQVLPRPGDFYITYDTVAVCESGVIAVEVENTVVKGAQARFNVTTKMWTDDAASATVLTIPGAFFETAGSGVVALRYRRPQPSLSAGA